MKRFLAFLLVSWTVWSGPAAGFELHSFVGSIVEAYGGPEALARLKAFRLNADVRSEMSGATGKEQREYLAPDKLRVEIHWPGRSETRILNGDRAWTGTGGRLVPANRPLVLAMVYEMLRSTVPESLVLHERLLQDGGMQVREGHEYRRIRLRWSEDLELTFWADTKSLRVEFVDGSVHVGDTRMRFATAYRDYRRMKGVLLPFVEKNYAMGQLVATTRVRSFVPSPRGLGSFGPRR